MKLSELRNPAFQSAMKKLMAEQLPLKTAFKLKGISQSMDKELEKYEEVRQEALKRFGTKKEDGTLDTDEAGNVKFEQDNLKKFALEVQELLSADVEVGTLALEDLGDKLTLSANELLVLDCLIQQ